MIEVKLFTTSYVSQLYTNLENSLSKYFLESFPFDPKHPKGNTGIVLNENFHLDPEVGDYVNSIKLYESLKSLNETQASDQRLWTYLCHVTFWQYMRQRWPVERANSKFNRIRDRYFFRSLNLRTLSRNGISRLWWFAHLTYDSNNSEDPYHLTRVMMENSDLTQNILERSYGSNKKVRFAILKYLKDHPDMMKQEKYRGLLKAINLLSGVKILSTLDEEEILSDIDHLANRI